MPTLRQSDFSADFPHGGSVSKDELAELQRVCRKAALGGGDLGVIAGEIRAASDALQELERRVRLFLESSS